MLGCPRYVCTYTKNKNPCACTCAHAYVCLLAAQADPATEPSLLQDSHCWGKWDVSCFRNKCRANTAATWSKRCAVVSTNLRASRPSRHFTFPRATLDLKKGETARRRPTLGESQDKEARVKQMKMDGWMGGWMDGWVDGWG